MKPRKGTGRPEALANTLIEERDALKAQLELQCKNYDELKNALNTVSCLKTEYEACIASLHKEKERYQTLIRELIAMKGSYQKQFQHFSGEIKGIGRNTTIKNRKE